MLDLLEIARKWVTEKGWDVNGYEFKISEVQSCPEGQYSVDICKKPEDDIDQHEQVRMSRVLEIDGATGKVENVLAGRDASALSKLLELEKIYSRTNAMEEEIHVHESKRKADAEKEKRDHN